MQTMLIVLLVVISLAAVRYGKDTREDPPDEHGRSSHHPDQRPTLMGDIAAAYHHIKRGGELYRELLLLPIDARDRDQSSKP